MGRNRDLVSVIVPVYNVEKHLDQCLESILGQTYRNLEILLIDDGSTDGSLEIMNRYAEQDSRVRVFHKENGGVSSARNMGLEAMGGSYCAFVDPDDYVSEMYVERLYYGVKKYDADLSICGYCSVAPSEEARFSSGHDKQMSWVIPSAEFSFFENAYGSAHFVSWGALYKKSLISNLRFDESVFYSEDALFFANCMVQSKKCVRINEKLYAYVEHEQSATHDGYNPKMWTEVDAWNEIVNQTKNGPANLHKSAESFYVLNCSAILARMLFSPYYEPEEARYLIREIRRHYKAITYIPRSRRLLRSRLTATLLLPRLTSVLLRCKAEGFRNASTALFRAVFLDRGKAEG